MNRERAILFSAPMVRALLDGTKTQTRRPVKMEGALLGPCTLDVEPHALQWKVSWDAPTNFGGEVQMNDGSALIRCPYGVPGDRLWVREAWHVEAIHDGTPPRDIPPTRHIEYEAGRHEVMWPAAMGKLRPSMFMPRWASRITLEITEVRVERLQDISEEDAKAEGAWPDASIVGTVAEHFDCDPMSVHPSLAYRMVWEIINGAGSWDANPWVWVVSFNRAPPQPGAAQPKEAP